MHTNDILYAVLQCIKKQGSILFQGVSSLLLNHLTALGKVTGSWHAWGAWALPTPNIFIWGILSKKISLCLFFFFSFLVLFCFLYFQKTYVLHSKESLGCLLGRRSDLKTKLTFQILIYICASDSEECLWIRLGKVEISAHT